MGKLHVTTLNKHLYMQLEIDTQALEHSDHYT